MSATYITLCNKVLRRLNETTFTSATFGTLTGFHGQVQDAVNDAVRDINHAEYEWSFNSSATTVTLTSGTQLYTLTSAAPSFSHIDWDSFYLVKGVPDSTIFAKPLPYVDYDLWRQERKADDLNLSAATYTAIENVFKTQQDQFGVTPVPDKAYQVGFEYWTSPTELSGVTDTTSIPSRYNYVIVDGAMWYCYMFRDNVEAASVMEKKFKEGIKRMRIELINRYDSARSDYIITPRYAGPNPKYF